MVGLKRNFAIVAWHFATLYIDLIIYANMFHVVIPIICEKSLVHQTGLDVIRLSLPENIYKPYPKKRVI